ncbi:glutathione hydrolase 1 proenzyme-like [Engraulis encrasicolus]|uniref:glutathione hydrolase 1 proenzyme-like n=1 Tax=Engraulis encrasicolus TaxID=184585 RepID=UPI002FD21340
MVKKTVVVGLAVLLVAAVSIFVGVFFGVGTRKDPVVTNGPFKAAVAADAGPCSEIGRDILQKGGSAVDGAIAALLCVGMMNPHSMGIGGGLFITIYNANTGTVETINARETAPINATTGMFGGDKDLARNGGLAIAVPGEIRGYELAHQRHGKLPWPELFLPSIRLAREGFPVGNALAKAIYSQRNTIANDPALREVFCDADGNILKENATIRFPRLAETYETIANEGPDAFYKGPIAENMVNDIRAAGGIISLEDLEQYQARLEKPLCVPVLQYNMCVPEPPSSGAVLALIINILKGYNFGPDSVSTREKKVLTYHRIVEAFRFGYAKRSILGDPEFLNITDFVQNITSDSLASLFRSKIMDDTTQPEDYYEPEYYVADDHGTSHVSFIAEDGSAVAVTSTINTYFGSKVMSGSTGILMNNEMDDFSSPNITNSFGVEPSPNNFIIPGKRPLSSMVPTIFFDQENKVKLVVGGSGGTKITTAIASVILHALFFKYDLETSVVEPRIHNQLRPNITYGETDFDTDLLAGLKEKNHNTGLLTSVGAVVQAVMRVGDGVAAKSDPRKGGYAAGY